LVLQKQDHSSPSLYQNHIDLSSVIIWYQEPSFCDSPKLDFECVVIGRRDWRETAFIHDGVEEEEEEDEEEEREVVEKGKIAKGEVEEGEDNEVKVVEYLAVLLLTPLDCNGVQYREGLVLITPYWWLKLKREWKLTSLG